MPCGFFFAQADADHGGFPQKGVAPVAEMFWPRKTTGEDPGIPRKKMGGIFGTDSGSLTKSLALSKDTLSTVLVNDSEGP